MNNKFNKTKDFNLFKINKLFSQINKSISWTNLNNYKIRIRVKNKISNLFQMIKKIKN